MSRTTDLVTRSPGNPILTAEDVPYPVATVHNPAAARLDDGRIVLVFRSHRANGRSILGVADSADGERFTVRPEPWLTPSDREPLAAYEGAARRRATHEQQNAARGPQLGSDQDPEPEPDPHRRPAAGARQSDYARWLDEQDARRPPSRAELESAADRAAAEAVAAGGGIEAILEATGLRTRENVLTLIDPAILEHAGRNDTAHAAAAEPDPPG